MSDFSFVPLRSFFSATLGRSNFDKGLHNLITLIQKRHKIMIEMKLLFYIYTYSLLPWKSVGRSIFDLGWQELNNVDSNNDIQI